MVSRAEMGVAALAARLVVAGWQRARLRASAPNKSLTTRRP
jgi:hypothetical protein